MIFLSQVRKMFPTGLNFGDKAKGWTLRTLFLAGMVLAITGAMIGCGGGGDTVFIAFPGLVSIDESSNATAPLLIVTYRAPGSSASATVNIFSDIASDGDIAFDPVLGTLTLNTAPSELFFGEDSLNSHLPEFRAFLTFPLDGVTGQPVVPSNAEIVSATLEVAVKRVIFASIIPTFLDLVQYDFRSLSAADFNTPLLTPASFRRFDIFSSDEGKLVRIDVTSLMRELQQPPALNDFQVRFSVDMAAVSSLSQSSSPDAGRSVNHKPRELDKVVLDRLPSSEKPLSPEVMTSRHR